MIRRFEGVARAIAVTFWFMTATFSWLVSVPDGSAGARCR